MNEKKLLYLYEKVFVGSNTIIGFGSESFYVKEISRKLANEIIITNHYSKKVYKGTYIHLGIYLDTRLVGVLQYGYAMNPASASSVVKHTKIDEYLELNRLWLDDIAPRNSESKAISYSIKYIKSKFRKIKWIQSFADERCGGFGIVYQACSFSYYGEHTSIFWTLKGEVYHNSLMTRNPKLSKSASFLQEHKAEATKEALRQFRYIKFIDQRCKKDCNYKELPYIKFYKE